MYAIHPPCSPLLVLSQLHISMLRYPFGLPTLGKAVCLSCHKCGGVLLQDVEVEIDNQSMSEDGMEQLPT